MRQRVPTFVCGPVIDGKTEHSATALREKMRLRRRHGRSNPAVEVMEDISPLMAAAELGDMFELPEGYHESAGTVWKLLKTSIEDDGTAWGAYIAADEAGVVDENDVRNFTMEELQDSYEIELAPLADIESWIQMSAMLRDSVDRNPSARRSSRVRRTINRLVPSVH